MKVYVKSAENRKKVILSGHNQKAIIDLTGLNEGVYFVVAESSNGNRSLAKIVKF